MSTSNPQDRQPTPEEMAQMQQVANAGAQAGVEASAGGAPPEEASAAAKKAMRKKADEVKLEIPDEQIDQIADAFVGKVIEQFEQRGAFDAPPEPVRAPTQQEQAPPPPREAEQTPAPTEPAPQRPQKSSWASKYFGAS